MLYIGGQRGVFSVNFSQGTWLYAHTVCLCIVWICMSPVFRIVNPTSNQARLVPYSCPLTPARSLVLVIQSKQTDKLHIMWDIFYSYVNSLTKVPVRVHSWQCKHCKFDNILIVAQSEWMVLYSAGRLVAGRFRVEFKQLYMSTHSVGPNWVHVLPLGLAEERSVHYIWYWSKRSECAALRRCSGTKCPLFFVIIFHFLSPPDTFLPEATVLGFLKFCTEFWVKKKERFWVKKD